MEAKVIAALKRYRLLPHPTLMEIAKGKSGEALAVIHRLRAEQKIIEEWPGGHTKHTA